jgi:hypothetical protein
LLSHDDNDPTHKQHKLINDLGAVVIQKPYSLEGLGRKVREILDQAQQK